MNKWFDDREYFTGKTCKALEKYLREEFKIDAEVHKTDTFIITNYIKDGRLNTCKVRQNGPFYCTKKEHVDELINTIQQ